MQTRTRIIKKLYHRLHITKTFENSRRLLFIDKDNKFFLKSVDMDSLNYLTHGSFYCTSSSYCQVSISYKHRVNPFLANVPILYHLKTKSFLVFSGGIKWEHWPEIG